MLTRPGSLIELSVQDMEDLKNRIVNKAKYYKENKDAINHSNALLTSSLGGANAVNCSNNNGSDRISLTFGHQQEGEGSIILTSQPINNTPSNNSADQIHM